MPRRPWRKFPRSPTLSCSSWSGCLRPIPALKTLMRTVTIWASTLHPDWPRAAWNRFSANKQYARLLARRCEREDGAALRIRYAAALADAGELDEAEAVITQLVAEVPDEQEAWMLCLRLAVMRRDGEAVQQVIDAIDKQHVYLSADNREKLAFWRDGEEAR